MDKQNIQKEIIETAKELGIGVYMVEEFITNPRILKFREVVIRNKEKEMLDDEITFLEDLLEYDTLDGMARIKADERLEKIKCAKNNL